MADGDSGLQIIDVSNPSSPALLGSYDTPDLARGVYVSGMTAYVADDFSGLQIIDVSNPSSPALLGSYDTPDRAIGVYVSGTTVYVADWTSGLQIIDVSNPALPALLGSYDTPDLAYGIYVSGTTAYVADEISGLQIIDVSNPSSPTLLGSYDTLGAAVGVYVSGTTAYVADWGSGLQIIDVSNPSSPALLGSYDTPNLAFGVYVSGTTAYVADRESGLQIINVSNPSAPALLGSYDTLGYAIGVYVSGTTAYVADGDSGLQIIDVSDCIFNVLPNKGGDTGFVTVRIRGGNFVDGATVRLVKEGQLDIVGDPVNVAEDGKTITTTFDLRDKAQGVWDVVVTNPDGGESFTFPESFTIEAGKAPQLWVDIIGRDQIRIGRPQTYKILVGNSGNEDAYGVILWIHIPKDWQWKLKFDVLTPPGEFDPAINWDEVANYLEEDEENIISLYIPLVSAGGRFEKEIELNVPLGIAVSPKTLGVSISGPFSEEPFSRDINRLEDRGIKKECFVEALDVALSVALRIAIPMECLATSTEYFKDVHILLAKKVTTGSINQLLFGLGQVIITCAADSIPQLKGVKMTMELVDAALRAYNLVKECELGKRPETPNKNKGVQPVVAIDPNEKVGVAGFDHEGTSSEQRKHYVAQVQPFQYVIYFENVKTATAPAQEVTIIDDLDMDKLDLSTLCFGEISFGKNNSGEQYEVKPSDDCTKYLATTIETDIDLDPDPEKTRYLLVQVKADLNTDTGRATWHFKSLDPATWELPEDPMAGFLPPNINPPEGEGSVMFTVMPNEGLNTNTEIRNKATIVFDVNPPIDTNAWLNTIDDTKPESQVHPLDATQSSTDFTVEWSGTDDDSGVKDYTILVSEDSGSYTPWHTNTPDTSEIFTGQSGKTYSFYSVARDHTGNLEDVPTIADATTKVKDVCQCADDSEPPTGCISGTVRDRASNPLERKTVKLNRTSPLRPKVKMETVTDSDGCYRFPDLPDGKYKIKVKKCKGGGTKTVIISGGNKVNDRNFQCR